jgi:hypothetical protein
MGGPKDRPGHFGEENGLSPQPKMFVSPPRSVVTIRTVCYPVSGAKILSKKDNEFHFWPLNVVLTLFCIVDNGLRETESWGPQTSVNGTNFVPSYWTVYWNFVAIYSK